LRSEDGSTVTARERKPGVWELIVHAGRYPLTGKPKYRSRTVRGMKRTAQRALDDLVGEVDHGVVATGEHTVAEALDRWLELAALDLSPTTLREYRRLIEKRIRPALGDIRLSRLSTADLDAFYAALVCEPSSRPRPSDESTPSSDVGSDKPFVGSGSTPTRRSTQPSPGYAETRSHRPCPTRSGW
jgi:hypothetical protein